MDFLKMIWNKVLTKKVPVYASVLVVVVAAGILVGCGLIPTSYTTSSAQRKLAQENSLQTLEFYRRVDTMSRSGLKTIAKMNVESAMKMEEIITGKESTAKSIFLKIVAAQDKSSANKDEAPEKEGK